MSAVLTSFLFASIVSAKVLPRDVDARVSSVRRSTSFGPIDTTFTDDDPIMSVTFTISEIFTTDFPTTTPPDTEVSETTIFIPIPSQGDYTTTTVSACTKADGDVIDSFVVVGVPTGTFSPGVTKSIPVPPQAEPTTVTYYDYYPSNDTEVVVIQPLPGACGAFIAPPIPADPSEVDEPTASPSAVSCPDTQCSTALSRAAETVIDALNEATQLSMLLQKPAERIGDPSSASTGFASAFPSPTDAAAMSGTSLADAAVAVAVGDPILTVATGLTRLADSLSTSLPAFSSFPAFDLDCSADTIVLAYLEFAQLLGELFTVLIGRSGLLERNPAKRETTAFAGRPIEVALQKLETEVDALAVVVVNLVPGRADCSSARGGELKAKMGKAERSYEG